MPTYFKDPIGEEKPYDWEPGDKSYIDSEYDVKFVNEKIDATGNRTYDSKMIRKKGFQPRQIMNADGRPAPAIEALISSGQYRDIPKNVLDDYFGRRKSEEETIAAIKGTPVFNPAIGPQVNTGEGKRSLTPEEQAALAAGKPITEVVKPPQPPQNGLPGAPTLPGQQIQGPGIQAPPVIETTQPQNYTVQKGDSLSAIAKRLGVGVNDITGYRSGNPNLIFPGEVLTVKGTQKTVNPPSGSVLGATDTAGDTTATGGVNLSDPTSILDFLGKQYGVSGSNLSPSTGSPQNSLKDIVTEIATSLGLPDAKEKIKNVTKEIEDLQNDRDDEIAKINDNPFISESLRSKQVNKVIEKYDNKIDARTNSLKLLQDLEDDIRNEVQFAATLGVNLYDKEQDNLRDSLKMIIERAEKASDTKHSSVYTEFLDAQREGYKGTFTQYQNEDANRKRPVTNINVTEGDKQALEAVDIEQKLMGARGRDTKVSPDVYAKERNIARMSPDEFDKRFSYLLSAKERNNLGIKGGGLGFGDL